MRRIQLTLAAAVVAAAFTAAPVAAASADNPLDRVIWAVKCIGDSLGGNACVGP